MIEWISGEEECNAVPPARRPSCCAAVEQGLGSLGEFFEPLLLEVMSYAVGSPCEYAHLCELPSRTLRGQLRSRKMAAWKELYARRWPAFYEAAQCQGTQDWLEHYRATMSGKVEVVLEVFERERKVGFAMSAMAAKVQYEAVVDAYVARYLSASEVPPEAIPSGEEHRLRFCPSSARKQLQPCATDDGAALYPHRVLQGFEGLEVGKGVELQWKMQAGSPFGWWFGYLETIRKEDSGKVAEATITFRHFPASSRWYRLVIRFGDGETRPCAFGGFTGGVRAVAHDEQRRWMRYIPTSPVLHSQDTS